MDAYCLQTESRAAVPAMQNYILPYPAKDCFGLECKFKKSICHAQMISGWGSGEEAWNVFPIVQNVRNVFGDFIQADAVAICSYACGPWFLFGLCLRNRY